jgi:hypothetical protein
LLAFDKIIVLFTSSSKEVTRHYGFNMIFAVDKGNRFDRSNSLKVIIFFAIGGNDD